MRDPDDGPDAEHDVSDAKHGFPDAEHDHPDESLDARDEEHGVPDGETASSADVEADAASQPAGDPTPTSGASGGSTNEAGRESRGVAIWALLFGIASVFCCFPAGIIAIVLGVRGRRRTVGNTTMATLGLLLGVIGLLGTAVAFGYYSGVLG